MDPFSQGPLGVGDVLPDITLPGDKSKLIRVLSHVESGRLVLLFCPDPRLPACREQLNSFARYHQRWAPLAKIFAVTNTRPEQNAAFLEGNPLPFRILSDLGCEVASALGVGHNLTGTAGPDGTAAFSIVHVDINRRILKLVRDVDDPDPAPTATDFVASLPRNAPRTPSRFAPILYVPDVLEAEVCRALIRAFETGETIESGFNRPGSHLRDRDHYLNPDRKSRRDHRLADPALVEAVKVRLIRRVFPDIQKAFTRTVSRIEEFKVSRYDAEAGGFFDAHRDNTARQFLHRRFAMSLNLNAGEYEGGGLTFPEYGPEHYRPGTGDAIVFSCSLLHEAMPVTKGVRYVLLAFLFDEESRQFNEEFR